MLKYIIYLLFNDISNERNKCICYSFFKILDILCDFFIYENKNCIIIY